MPYPDYTAAARRRPATHAAWLGGIAVLAVALFCMAPASADDDDWRQLHREVQAGRIKPLSEILDLLSQDWVGEVLEVEIEKDDGQWIYEIELLGPRGQVVEFEIDARSGDIVEMEGRNLNGMRRQ